MLLSFWSTCPKLFLTQLLRSFVSSNTGSLRVNCINMDGHAPKTRWTHWEFAAKAPVEPFGSWTKKNQLCNQKEGFGNVLNMSLICLYDLPGLIDSMGLLQVLVPQPCSPAWNCIWRAFWSWMSSLTPLQPPESPPTLGKNPVLSTRNLRCNSSEVGCGYSLEIEQGTWRGKACLSSLPSIVARWRLVASS